MTKLERAKKLEELKAMSDEDYANRCGRCPACQGRIQRRNNTCRRCGRVYVKVVG